MTPDYRWPLRGGGMRPPVFVGTRVPVKNLTGNLVAGGSLDEFLALSRP